MRVGFNFDRARGVALQRDLLILREKAHLIGGAGDKLGEVESLARHQSFSGVEARDCQQALDYLRKTLGFLERAADRLPNVKRKIRPLSYRFEFSAQDRQRSAQLVRRIRAKAIDVPERMLDSRDHSIERS